jgi:hypothetical protein
MLILFSFPFLRENRYEDLAHNSRVRAGGFQICRQAADSSFTVIRKHYPVGDLCAKPISWVMTTIVMPSLASRIDVSSMVYRV